MSAYLCEPADFVALARYAKRPCNGFNGYNIFTKERIGGEDGELNVRDLAMELATANTLRTFVWVSLVVGVLLVSMTRSRLTSRSPTATW
jgi:hypothetical protein